MDTSPIVHPIFVGCDFPYFWWFRLCGHFWGDLVDFPWFSWEFSHLWKSKHQRIWCLWIWGYLPRMYSYQGKWWLNSGSRLSWQVNQQIWVPGYPTSKQELRLRRYIADFSVYYVPKLQQIGYRPIMVQTEWFTGIQSKWLVRFNAPSREPFNSSLVDHIFELQFQCCFSGAPKNIQEVSWWCESPNIQVVGAFKIISVYSYT